MKITNQKGFTALHILLLLVLLGIIGFAGWKVYQTNRPPKPAESSAQVSTTKQPDSQTAQAKIPDGWVEYKNQELGFKFNYPKDWQNVSLTDSDKKFGAVLSLVSPKQHQAYQDFIKLGKQTEGPVNSDLYISRWDSINNENLKSGLGALEKLNSLDEFISKSDFSSSRLKKIGEINLAGQKVYLILVQGFSQTYGLIFEKPDKSVIEFDFVNVWDESHADQTTKAIINSIQIF